MKEQTLQAIENFARKTVRAIRSIRPETDAPVIEEFESAADELIYALGEEKVER